MKRYIVAVLALSAAQLFAQKCVNPHFDAQRLDFRDLGYPGATEIPADSSPITALLAHSNGRVYGATTVSPAGNFRILVANGQTCASG